MPRLALQDSVNVDLGCLLLNNDEFLGCDGSFGDYVFTEERSVCACNGLMGDVDGRDCFPWGSDGYYSSRFWDASFKVFGDSPTDRYPKNEWHLVEAYFQLNTIVDGIGVPDGIIRYVVDGEVVVASDRVLMRTGQHPHMRFNQLLMAPYMGDGSPVDQRMWIDDLTVATGRP